MLFKPGEDLDNYQTILDEYREAVIVREDIKDKLYKEIKIIKKLRV